MKQKTLSPTTGGLKLLTFFLFLLPLSIIFFGAGCEKDDTNYAPNSIVGKWKWLYTEGGTIGATYPQEGQTVIWEFTEDSLLIVPFLPTNVNYQVSGDTLRYSAGAEITYRFQIRNDTLGLTALPDAYAFIFLKRIK